MPNPQQPLLPFAYTHQRSQEQRMLERLLPDARYAVVRRGEPCSLEGSASRGRLNGSQFRQAARSRNTQLSISHTPARLPPPTTTHLKKAPRLSRIPTHPHVAPNTLPSLRRIEEQPTTPLTRADPHALHRQAQ